MPTMAWLEFETPGVPYDGFMVWIQGITPPGRPAGDWIAAGSATGLGEIFPDDWDQNAVTEGTPPEGYFIPQRGLGHAWAVHNLVKVIGYAKAEKETIYTGKVIIEGDTWRIESPSGRIRSLVEFATEPTEPPPVPLPPPPIPEPRNGPPSGLPPYWCPISFRWAPWLNIKLPSGEGRNLAYYKGYSPISGGNAIMVTWVGYQVTVGPDTSGAKAVTLIGETNEILTAEDSTAFLDYLTLLGEITLPYKETGAEDLG